MSRVMATLQGTLTDQIWTLLAALAVLVLGWLVALLVAVLVRRGLSRTEVDNRLARWLVGEGKEQKVEIERWVGRGVFWLLMLFVLVGFFEVLGLEMVTRPLDGFLTRIFEYLPRLIAPVVLGLVAWLVASGLRFAVRRVLGALDLDARLGHEAGIEEPAGIPLSSTVSEAVYWVVLLLFLPAILSALDLGGLLQPVQSMVDEVLGFLPNLLAAGLILAAGWLLARVLQRIVSNLLAAVGADRLADQVGLGKALGEQRLSGLIGLTLYVLVLIPVLIAALNTLHLDAVTRPASEMLNTVLAALPRLFGAAVVLLIAFLIGRVVAGLVSNLLAGVGFNRLAADLGIGSVDAEDGRSAAEIAGSLVLVAILLFATIEAVGLLGFTVLAELVAQFLVFAGHVLLGLIVFGVGLYLGNLASRTIRASDSSQAPLLATAARVSIVALSGAMALRQMGLANEIITLAFGLVVGTVAVAVALAFGLGCRDLAADSMRGWLDSVRTRQP